MIMDKKRVIVYVDGYNFYYGLKMEVPHGNAFIGWILLSSSNV